MAHPLPRRDRRATRRSEPLSLLIVDDDLLHAQVLRSTIERPGRLDVEIADSAIAALARLARGPLDAIVSDVVMPDMDGIELVRRIREADVSLPVILMTAHASIPRAVEGIRAGATDFLAKPVDVDALGAFVERAVAQRPVRAALAERDERRAAASAASFLVGEHPRLEAIRDFVDRTAHGSPSPILVSGEPGTGKSLLAYAVHELADASGSFLEVNCAAWAPHLLEAELFGAESGAFGDGREVKRGLLELAEKGTLVVNESGAMPLELQGRLLLALDRREFTRVQGLHTIPLNARVVAASTVPLRERVAARAFRQDLLQRLEPASVEMPPLREAREIVPALARHFAALLCREQCRPPVELSPFGAELLSGHPWPGNARELRNAVERALITYAGGPLHVVPPSAAGATTAGEATAHEVPADETSESDGVRLPLGLSLEEVERRYLTATLEGAPGELGAAAERLGISRKTLWEKRKRYAL